MPRDIITLACTECKERNYTGTRNKKLETTRREIKKYCPRDKRHTLHRETK
ncbi:50S ribosomal protein L33 [Pontiella sp.]|jgi:large subunit ribosomal protein L33|uniref:50S ribosomal protein L33 n=1 Tax=Pontiella sp. TaxID=2837462 RepID=UPI003563E100